MSGTSNFQQWNPSATNQESDSAYTSDALRTGGAVNPSAFPSGTANKLFFQLSTFVTALAQALSGKGYSLSDANLNNLASVLTAIMTQADMAPYATLASPALTGAPTGPTPASADATGKLATTAWVAQALGTGGTTYNPDFNSVTLAGIDAGNGGQVRMTNTNFGVALRNDGGSFYILLTPSGAPNGQFNTLRPFTINLATGALTIDATSAGVNFGTNPIVPTPPPGDNTNKVPNTAWVNAEFAPVATPVFTGSPQAPTPAVAESSGIIPNTYWVKANFAPLVTPVFSGNPQTPTPGAADSSGSIPNTYWVNEQAYMKAANFPVSLASPGYQKLPNGLILQWGLSAAIAPNSGGTVTYGLAFPNTPFSVTATYSNNQTVNTPAIGNPINLYNTGAKTGFALWNGGSASSQYYWLAIGY